MHHSSMDEFAHHYRNRSDFSDFVTYTLGAPVYDREKLSPFSDQVVSAIEALAPDQSDRLAAFVFGSGTLENVAVLTLAMLIDRHITLPRDPRYYCGDDALMMGNVPLLISIAHLPCLDYETMTIDADMPVVSVGLFDCARRTCAQIRNIGCVVDPITTVRPELIDQCHAFLGQFLSQ